MPQPRLLKAFRLTHLYFGVFISPALLFFAFTGALQTFGLHETNRDHPNYKPAHWIQVLSQIHKKQVDTVPVRRPQPAAAPLPGAPEAASPDATHPHHTGDIEAQPVQNTLPATQQAHKANPLPLRIFFLIASIGLLSSTLTGLYMAYVYQRNKRLVTLALVAGILLPPLLLLF